MVCWWTMKDQLFQLFKNQSKHFAVGEDMLVDFAYKALNSSTGFLEKDIAEAIGEYYHQCNEICFNKIKQAKDLMVVNTKEETAKNTEIFNIFNA